MRITGTLPLATLLLSIAAPAQIAVKNQGFVPFADEPINYRSDNLFDPVAKLQKAIDKGQTTLAWEPPHGYLKSVLDALKIPIESQTLVFSKTSFQYKKISPATPRALYFNDDVYVGQVHDGKVLEFVSFDAMQGAIFYILDEKQADHPTFERAELDCTQCHVAAGTRNVPGVLLRSISTRPSGTQAEHSPSYITGQESPLHQRWGGWYVTGLRAAEENMGNALVEDPENPTEAAPVEMAKQIDTSAYLFPESDVVAHLVLAHQTQMHNLITLTNYRTRIAQYEHKPDKEWQTPAEQLVRYLLFADEAPLNAAVDEKSRYAEQFSALGPRDSSGRSLRDFDLKTRIFRYPCSYLIYSGAFDALPDPAKQYVYHRLFEILTGRDQDPAFARLTLKDRSAIFEILVATKPGLPPEWTSEAWASKGKPHSTNQQGDRQ
jgi:hypothetical protein